MNGTALTTTAMTTAYGGFIVFLDTAGADAGFYVVSVSAGGSESATTSFVLDAGAPLQVQEGGGTTLNVPGGIAIPYTSVVHADISSLVFRFLPPSLLSQASGKGGGGVLEGWD